MLHNYYSRHYFVDHKIVDQINLIDYLVTFGRIWSRSSKFGRIWSHFPFII